MQSLVGFVVRDCTGDGNKGALYIGNSAQIRVHNCTFEFNSGAWGAIGIHESGSPVFSSVVLSNNFPNSAANVGGGSPSFVDCRFGDILLVFFQAHARKLCY